jgi:hypothetical protein
MFDEAGTFTHYPEIVQALSSQKGIRPDKRHTPVDGPGRKPGFERGAERLEEDESV